MAKAHEPIETDATALALWAGAGHDLSQPIQSLLLMTHIMSLTEDGEKRKLTARSMEHALEMLQGMIGDLTRIARREAGDAPPTFADVAVDKMLMRVAAQNRSLAHSYALTLSVEETHANASFDEHLAAEIIDGLLRNAIVMAKGGDVCMRASKRFGRVDIEIAYDGPRLTAQQMNATFTELAGVHAGAKPTPGLKMLKIMARQMAALITVVSKAEMRQVLALSLAHRD